MDRSLLARGFLDGDAELVGAAMCPACLCGADLRQRPVPVEAEEIDGKVKMTGEVRLDDDKSGQMSFRIRLSH